MEYARVMAGGAAGGRSGSLVVAVGLLVVVLVLGRRYERLGFAMAIAAIPLGSPVAAGHTWALLVAALAPWIRRGVVNTLRVPPPNAGTPPAGQEALAERTQTAPSSSA